MRAITHCASRHTYCPDPFLSEYGDERGGGGTQGPHGVSTPSFSCRSAEIESSPRLHMITFWLGWSELTGQWGERMLGHLNDPGWGEGRLNHDTIRGIKREIQLSLGGGEGGGGNTLYLSSPFFSQTTPHTRTHFLALSFAYPQPRSASSW